MKRSQVISIGAQAIGEEPLLLLFDQTATRSLKEYSIVQEWEDEAALQLKAGDTVKFDDQLYTIAWVGPSANNNLNEIAHVSLVFTDVPAEDQIANGLYLTPHSLPEIKIGTTITYG